MKRNINYSMNHDKYESYNFNSIESQRKAVSHRDQILSSIKDKIINHNQGILRKFIPISFNKKHKTNREKYNNNNKNYQSLIMLQADDNDIASEQMDTMPIEMEEQKTKEKVQHSKMTIYESGLQTLRNKWKINILRRKNNGKYGQIIKGNPKERHHSLMSRMDIYNSQKKTALDLNTIQQRQVIYHTDRQNHQTIYNNIRLVISKNAARKILPKKKLKDKNRMSSYQKALKQTIGQKRINQNQKRVVKTEHLQLKQIFKWPKRYKINTFKTTPSPWEVIPEF